MSQVEGAPAGTAMLPPDDVVVSRLRAGDEVMFAALVDAWSPGMLRAARAFVAGGHTAEDVVQEAWLGVLRGIGSFQARSSLRTGDAPAPGRGSGGAARLAAGRGFAARCAGVQQRGGVRHAGHQPRYVRVLLHRARASLRGTWRTG